MKEKKNSNNAIDNRNSVAPNRELIVNEIKKV